MSLKSNKELEIILKEKNDYNQEAIQAVVWEMEVRNLIQKTDDLYKDTFKESDAIQTVEKAIDHNEHLSREMVLPHLYSKRAIQGFTLFFFNNIRSSFIDAKFKRNEQTCGKKSSAFFWNCIYYDFGNTFELSS